jgi:hypothetical protein
MQTNSAVLAWLSRSQPDPLAGGINMQTRPPVFRDPIVEVTVLVPIFVAGIAREIGSKVLMASSDAHGLSNSVPPSVECNK